MNEGIDAGRELALPVYRATGQPVDRTDVSPDYKPGRLLLGLHRASQHDDEKMRGGPIRAELLDRLGPNDVVWIPLFHGSSTHVGKGFDQREPWYEENLAVLRQIAPEVKAVLIGNAGPELCGKHIWWQDKTRSRRVSSQHMTEFAKRAGGLVREAEGRPAFGTMDADLLCDAYHCDGLLRETMMDLNAIQIVFCGHKIVLDNMPDWYQEQFSVGWPAVRQPMLRHYLNGLQVWGGVGGLAGLKKGTERLMKRAGFTAGVLEPQEERNEQRT